MAGTDAGRANSYMNANSSKPDGGHALTITPREVVVNALSREWQLLLLSGKLLSDASSDESARELVRGGVNWDQVQALAAQHGLTALLYRCLARLEASEIPRDVLGRLWAATEMQRHRNRRRAEELSSLLDLLDKAGILAVPFKGPVLTQSLYGDIALREFGDLDILVRHADVLRARSLLATKGYVDATPIAPELEVAFISAKRQYDFELVHETTGAMVELHWKTNSEFPVERLDDATWWAALDTAELNGNCVRNLRRRELLLVLLLHGSKHQWSRIGWLVDIALLARLCEDGDWHWLASTAKLMRCTKRAGLGLKLAQSLLNAAVPDFTMRALCPTPTMERMVRNVKDSLLEPDVETVSQFTWLRRDVSLYDTGWQRLRQMALLIMTPNASEWSHHANKHNAILAPASARTWRLIKKYMFRMTDNVA